MKRGGAIWIPVAIAAGLQCTYLAAWQPWGVVPDLTLIVLIRAVLLTSPVPSLVAALVGGLILDLAAGDRFGLRLSFLVVVVLALTWLRRGGVAFGFWLELGAVAVTAAGYGLIQLASLVLAHATIGGVAGRLVVTVIFDVLLAALLYGVLGFVMKRLGGSREEVVR